LVFFFFDRLKTRDLMLRKQWHLDSGPACVLCTRNVTQSHDRGPPTHPLGSLKAFFQKIL
jgi:hypothetical protein